MLPPSESSEPLPSELNAFAALDARLGSYLGSSSFFP